MDQICPKLVIPVKNGKSEHYHSILHIRISLGTKFQLSVKARSGNQGLEWGEWGNKGGN